MSELAKTLELFGFLNIDDVTGDSLKKAFKTRILQAHPDKGGDADVFDNMLHSYVYLTHTIQRISGGRTTLQNILSPDELKRPDEIINRFFDEFQNDEFNRLFEEQKKETHGYASWLKGDELTEFDKKPEKIDEKDLHRLFEERHKGVSSSIILHPEAMALCSNIGTALVDNENCYTSEIFSNPEYTDLYSAFTVNNTIYDKVNMNVIDSKIDLNDVIMERNKDIVPLNDEELKAIQDYEQKKLNLSSKENSFFINL